MSALGRGMGEGWGKRESWEGGLQSGGTPGPSGACVASARSRLPLGAWWAERLLVGGLEATRVPVTGEVGGWSSPCGTRQPVEGGC